MRDLSIIFQGPLPPEDSKLFQHLRQTRQLFPHAEIILSTWHRTPASDNELHIRLEDMAIRLILNDDPGPLTGKDSSGTWSTNLNRLLCSARGGLEAATRPLAIKLRTDTWLSSRQLLPLLEQVVHQDSLPPRDQAYLVFRQRVITASWFARDARGSLPFLYHPGDILLAGLTDDLRLFFSAPLAGPELFHPSAMPGLWSAWRFVPEQWLWVHAIHRATGHHVFAGNFHHTPQQIIDSERYFLANFVPYSSRQLGLHWPKYWRRYPFRGLFSLYTHSRWLRRIQGEHTAPMRDMASRVLTGIWRAGYRVRAYFLRWAPLRALARNIFSHHQ